MMSATRPILLCAGGTGGHLFPAQALADELTMQDRDAWRYDVQACPRGFYVAVFDDDGHFLGVL